MLKDILSGFVSLFTASHSVEDRRKIIRLRCRYSVYAVYKGEVLTATAIDMGLQGIRLEVPERLKKGQTVHLLYRGAAGQPPVLKLSDVKRDLDNALKAGVECEVTWCRQDRYTKKIQAGVSYTDSPSRMSKSWVKKILREIGFDEESIFQRRKIMRVVAQIPFLARVDQATIKGQVLNLGAGGALLQADEALPPTLELRIGPYKKFNTLTIAGKVVTKRHESTSNSWLHGVRFQSPDEEQVDLLGKYVIALLKDNMA